MLTAKNVSYALNVSLVVCFGNFVCNVVFPEPMFPATAACIISEIFDKNKKRLSFFYKN